MKLTLRLILIVTLLGAASCSNPMRKRKEVPVAVDYTVVSRSPLFNKELTTFRMETFENNLVIRLDLKEMKHIAFPVSRTGRDTLFGTAFHFDLIKDGKIIRSDFMKNRRSLRWQTDSSATANDLSFVSDTIFMNSYNQLTYEIPLHAFHNLKQGKQNLELRIWQDTFKSEGSVKNAGNSLPETVSNYATRSLFDARIKFELMIPPIYKSEFYGLGLQLKNDSTFSPAGMDNTIWNSSYPDIYWMLYYPVGYPYAQTDYQKSTDAYTHTDTFKLYHYFVSDSLGIGTYDHDDLSRDDGLGYWTGSMDHLRREPRRRITFGYVKWFDAKLGKAVLVN